MNLDFVNISNYLSFTWYLPEMEKEKDPDLSIDSNLGQKSGNVWNVVNRLVGVDAGDLLLGDEGRGDGVGGGQRMNEQR
jgi:hypothetical protein